MKSYNAIKSSPKHKIHKPSRFKNPLITVITPSYNQGEFIEQTILSIVNQSYKNVEIIIVDNCSTDSTDSVIKKYHKKYKMKYVREKDSGQSNAINKGLDLAKGDIVCWLNSDDYYTNNNVLERVVQIFHENPTVDVISGDGQTVSETGHFLMPIRIAHKNHFSESYIRCYDYILQPSTFWKKNDIRLDETLHYAFDWKYFIDLYKNNYNFFYVPENFSSYRIHGQSKTQLNNSRRKKEIMEVIFYANGRENANYYWAMYVYKMYLLSEKSKIGVFKFIADLMNFIIKKLSGYVIYSC